MKPPKTSWFGTTYIRLHLTLVWVVGAAISVGILIYMFNATPEKRSVYIFIASALGILTGILTLLVRLYQNERQLEQARRTAALDFIMRWMDPNFDETRRKGRALYDELKARQQDTDTAAVNQQFRLQGLRQDNEKWSNFVDITNFFEALGIAFHHKQVDESIIQDFFRGIVVGYWNVFQPAIEARRAERDNTRLFQWFQNLYDAMKT